MNCKNKTCGVNIDNRKYCPLCGYANSELTFSAASPSVINIINEDGELILQLDNPRFHAVEANIAINDNNGIFALADISTGADNLSCTVDSRSKKDIRISYKLNPDQSITQCSFTLMLTTDDGMPDNALKRPQRIVKYWRTESYKVDVDVLMPGSLIISKRFLSFGYDYRQCVCVLSATYSASAADIEIVAVNAPPSYAFKAADGLSMNERVLKPGDICTMHLQYDGLFDNNTEGQMEIIYKSGGVTWQEHVTLFVIKRASIWRVDQVIPQYIVAIDFGTSKTTVAYIDTDSMFDANGNPCNPTVVMAKLGDKDYDMPSAVVYDGTRYVIGDDTNGYKQHMRADYIKMGLQDETISFLRTTMRGEIGKVENRDTLEVLTSFLRSLKRKLPKNLQDSDENLYVFTLPVLDREKENSSRYNKQRETTIKGAEQAGYKNGGSIATALESEAALIYIVNEILAGHLQVPAGLNVGDIIGVFDYGAGTLDITFGTYEISDGRPRIKASFSLGLYGESDDTSKGGNNLDKYLGIDVINDKLDEEDVAGVLPSSIVLEGSIMSDSGRLQSFSRFANDSIRYPCLTWLEFERTRVKQAKEQFAFSSKAMQIVMDGKNAYIGEQPTEHENLSTTDAIPCLAGSFDSLTQADAEEAVKTITAKLNEHGISSVKYLFMVGGSSLLRSHGSILRNGLAGMVGDVLTPYDYAGFPLDGSVTDAVLRKNCRALRDAAITAVVKGAAYSQVTRVDKNFEFTVIVRRKDSTVTLVTLEKGKPHPEKPIISRKPSSEANGTWGVYVVLEDGREEVLAEAFTVKHTSMQPVRFSVEVLSRVLTVSCSVGANTLLNTGGIIV